MLAALAAGAAACKTESARRAEIAACSERTADSLEIELCLTGNYRWKDDEARRAAGIRSRQLALLRRQREDSLWAADAPRHRQEIRQCGDEELSRCLMVRFGWPERRASAAADSVWQADAAKHRREAQACLAQGPSGVGACLQLRYKWPARRALALDDSLMRERLR